MLLFSTAVLPSCTPAGVFSDTRLLHSSQSITMKGAVRVAGSGPGKDLAANASLYTCLVMDMPLERLKLR